MYNGCVVGRDLQRAMQGFGAHRVNIVTCSFSHLQEKQQRYKGILLIGL